MIANGTLAIASEPELDLKLLAVEHPLDPGIILAGGMSTGRSHDGQQHSGAIIG